MTDIRTHPVTREYEQGHERAFGERKPTRRGRFVCRPGHPRADELGMVHVDDLGNWDGDKDERVPVLTDRYMEGVRSTDGVDIGSRSKRRDYMQANGLVDSSDLKGEFERAAKERYEKRTGTHEPTRRAIRDLVGRTAWELTEQARKRR